MAAPLGSETVPAVDPYVVWAEISGGKTVVKEKHSASCTSAIKAKLNRNFICAPTPQGFAGLRFSRRDRPLRLSSSTGTHDFHTLPSTICWSAYEYATRTDFVPHEICRNCRTEKLSRQKSSQELIAMMQISPQGGEITRLASV